MENKNIYLWTIILSLLLLIPASIWENRILTILSGIGCSGIAAAIMAIFLEMASLKKESMRKAKTRSIYFRTLKDQLKMLLERMLWFEERMSDESFDWDKDPSDYSSLSYMVFSNTYYPSDEKISFHEAETRLAVIKEKYDIDHIGELSKDQLCKARKMFMILASSSFPLLSEINSIKENRIELNAEDYMSLDEIDSLYFSISLGIALMYKPDKNYGAAVSSFISAYKSVCKVGDFTDDFVVGLHGSISMREI